jgi:c-di-GMP-binding flagellar brake protein YcgR
MRISATQPIVPPSSGLLVPDSAAPSAEFLPASDTADGYVTLDNRASTARMFEECFGLRSTLTIKLQVASRLHVFQTRIHHVDVVQGSVMLHRLSPAGWRELVDGPTAVEVSCQLPSGLYRCTTQLAPLEQDPQNPYSMLSFPDVLYRFQLRSSFRVNVPQHSSMIVLPWSEQVFNGNCVNLSLDGSCAFFRDNLSAWLRKDDVLDNLHFMLDGALQFRASAIVCRLEALPAGTRLGLRFQALDTALQRQLQAELTRLQRESLRRQTGL